MALTLWDCLGKVHDRRSRQGRRYSLRPVLGASTAAALGGCSSPGAIAQRMDDAGRKGLLGESGTERGRPCHSTLHHVFTNLNVKSFERVPAGRVAALGVAAERRLAMDGKTARRTTPALASSRSAASRSPAWSASSVRSRA